jgi:hypothetical protein
MDTLQIKVQYGCSQKKLNILFKGQDNEMGANGNMITRTLPAKTKHNIINPNTPHSPPISLTSKRAPLSSSSGGPKSENNIVEICVGECIHNCHFFECFD